MSEEKRAHLLASLLWGGVAAIGQYTMLFLSIIQRIHVRFPNDAPIFQVDPRGPIVLSKDTALASVWVLTFFFGLMVALLAYSRPRLHGKGRVLLAILGIALSGLAALADPWWGLIVLANSAIIYWMLTSPQGQTSTS